MRTGRWSDHDSGSSKWIPHQARLGTLPMSKRALLHKLHCPYCRYHWLHTGAEWNALSQDQRTAIVAKRTCKN
jgi:hypothetical protein